MPGRMATRVSCGRDFHCVPDINTALDTACKAGFDFVCLPIVNPRFKRECIQGPAKSRPGALTRSDLCLTSGDWSSLIVGKTSPWLQLDSEVEDIRKNSEQALKEELNYATHLGMPAVMLYLKTRKIMNLARCLNEHLLSGYFQQQFWVHVPIKAPVDCLEDLIEGETVDEERVTEDPWEWWNTFRTMCDTNKRISIALEITADLPEEDVLQRWLAEPIKAVIISTSLFLTNKKGYPVLSKAHQGFLRSLFKLDVQLILTGANKHADKGVHSYQQYLDHLWQDVFTSSRNDILADEIDCLWQTRETLPTPDTVTQFAKGYEDYLQCPLQPLMDNLESQTYEIFEKDPIKYSQYQKAVYCALLDKIKPENKDTESVVLMVVGAGRGPLVRASLAAASQADRNIRKVYAVEKNPNAVVTLENLRDEMWGDKVEVISCDMRQWNAPEKADILVSELLGSFGDNELSPECLDGAQRFLKDDGISIPCEYTSYLAPLQSSKLYNEVRASKDKDKPPETSFEMPYVVRLHNCRILSEPIPVFHFKHPNRDEVIDNTRYKTMEFQIEETSVLHGFAGYFDTKLYGDVYLSIVPETHSPGMFSWFPILFPVKSPQYLKKGCRVVVDFWRQVSAKNVWYEWCVLEPNVLPIHNPKGRSYTIGL